MPMPDEIVGLLRSNITFKWPDGHESRYRARDLRLACRCAMCIEETSGRALIEPATIPPQVQAKRIELVGQYAMLVEWSDGHSTGIYNFRDLRTNCPCEACTAARATSTAEES
jgi:ATP-binding protein involved in chromosome partitioning